MGGDRLVSGWRKYHKDVNGWLDIGYQYIVAPVADRPDEWDVFDGRPDWMTGAHSATNWGNQFLGINVAYGSDLSKIPDRALRVLADLIRVLSETYGFKINEDTIRDHNDFIGTECPGKLLEKAIPLLIEKATDTIPAYRKDPQTKPPGTPSQGIEEQIFKIKADFDGLECDAILVNSQAFVSLNELRRIGIIKEDLKWVSEERKAYAKLKAGTT